MVGMDLSFETRAVGGTTVLAVGGDVDLHTAPQLRDRIRTLVDEGTRRLVVDMTGVEFLDSTGLGTLLGSRKQLVALDGRLALAGLSDHVLKVFEITSLDQVFDIRPTVDEALRGIENGTPAGEPA
jgi:anti-sigma B factor antagonist